MPGVGTILSVREGDDSRFVHTDVQGTTRNVTSAAEAVVATYDLDAFGIQRSHTGAYSTPYLFTGKERDPGPSLDYFIARQYKAGRGVLLSKDPVGPHRGSYVYVMARPTALWDPPGLWGMDLHAYLVVYYAHLVRERWPGANYCSKAYIPSLIDRIGKGVDDADADVRTLGSSYHFSYWDWTFGVVTLPHPHTPDANRMATMARHYSAAIRLDRHRNPADCARAYEQLGWALHPAQDEFAHGAATPCEHVDAFNYWIDDPRVDTTWASSGRSSFHVSPVLDPLKELGAAWSWCLFTRVNHFEHHTGEERYRNTAMVTEVLLRDFLASSTYCFALSPVPATGGIPVPPIPGTAEPAPAPIGPEPPPERPPRDPDLPPGPDPMPAPGDMLIGVCYRDRQGNIRCN